MRKIPTIFERDWGGDKSRVVDQQHRDCAWVFAGHGVATRKLDGTCCMIRGGALFKRRELRMGEPRPPGFKLEDFDIETGKLVGWVPVGDGPEDRWHRDPFEGGEGLGDGTYELVGPKVQGNPERLRAHVLVSHADPSLVIEEPVPRDFGRLAWWLAGKDIEGVVFHHPDGRMGKIKLRDFGLQRP